MKAMKFAIGALLLLLIGSTLAIQLGGNNRNDVNQGNNYQFGQIGTATIINSGTVNVRFRFGKVVTQNYVYTAANATTDPNIAAIVITDLRQRNGATASIVSGGVGQKSVTIQFTSQRGFGISSRVEIYA